MPVTAEIAVSLIIGSVILGALMCALAEKRGDERAQEAERKLQDMAQRCEFNREVIMSMALEFEMSGASIRRFDSILDFLDTGCTSGSGIQARTRGAGAARGVINHFQGIIEEKDRLILQLSSEVHDATTPRMPGISNGPAEPSLKRPRRRIDKEELY